MSKEGNPDVWKSAWKGRQKQAAALRGRPQTAEHVAKRKASRERTLAATILVCVVCNKPFTPTQGAQKYCSGKCWNVKARKKREQQLKQQRITQIPRALYRELLAAQNGMCAICDHPNRGNSRGDRLAVDHDHETHQIRGLLCHRCNTALGLMRDKAELFTRAAQYLNNWSATHEPES